MCPDNVVDEDSFTAEAEGMVFGRQRRADEPFGVYCKLFLAQTTSPEVARGCQDGGIATTLLLFAMGKGLIDTALVTGMHPTKPFFPVPILATNSKEVLEAAGSKYTCSQNPLTLASEASKMGKARVAFVGTPCQVRALRRLQTACPPKLDFVNFSVGLMCSGCFNYEFIEELIHRKRGIDPTSIIKMNIKQKLQITTNARVTPVPLAEIKQYMRAGCAVCHDFSCELADISVGGLGLDGWTFTVIRSEKGEELFEKAEKAGFLRVQPVDAEANALKLLIKLSQKKNKNA
jgi:coenzyme F420 hydrogenase subunit beta